MNDLVRVYLIIFLITLSEGTINVVFPPFLEARAFAISQIGVLLSLLAAFQLLARIPAGLFYSRARVRLLLGGGLSLLGLSATGFALFSHAPGLVGMIVLHGFAFGAITTIALALCIEAKPRDYPSGAMMGWYTSAIAAGYSVGQPIGGYLADHFGYRAAFGSTATFSLLAVLVVLKVRGLSQGAAAVRGTDSAIRKEAASPAAGLWRIDPRQIPPGVWLAALIVFFLNLMYRSLHAFFPLYALAVGITLTQIGFLRSTLALAAAAVRPFSGSLFRHIDHRRVTHIAMVVAAAAVLLSPRLTFSISWLVVLFVFMGLARGLLRVTSATILAEYSEEARSDTVGVWSGVYNAGLDMGSIAGPAVGGYLAGLASIPTMLTIIALAVLASYAVIFVVARHRREQAVAQAAD